MTDTDCVKEYLNEVRYIDEEIDAKEEVRKKMWERLTSVKATEHREIDVQGGKRKTSEDRIIEYMEYSEDLNEMIDELVSLKMRVLNEIQNIDDGLYRTILTERYINNRKWDDISDMLGYDDSRNIFRVHNDALREFGKCNKVVSKSR